MPPAKFGEYRSTGSHPVMDYCYLRIIDYLIAMHTYPLAEICIFRTVENFLVKQHVGPFREIAAEYLACAYHIVWLYRTVWNLTGRYNVRIAAGQ